MLREVGIPADSPGQLPHHHEDPFDRMLIAQALAEGLTIVTRDKLSMAMTWRC
jgi:PIN domain nuclease of toxin-antitoxin system